MTSSNAVGRFLVWAIVLSMFASTVAIYAFQNPATLSMPFLPRERVAPQAQADMPVQADVAGWVLGPGNTVRGALVAWTPYAPAVYTLRIFLKDGAGGLLASASCREKAGAGEPRQDTVPFAVGPPLYAVEQVLLTIMEGASPSAPTCL
ncbi:hypothetical protein HRbin23_00933 [bacterium HR23]|nr:hypothetical protein HRbin23_00933 [bacterium HR23]